MDGHAAIAAAEARLCAAMLAGDVAALDRLIGADTIFVNQDGRRLTKADDLAAHRDGTLVLDQLTPVAEPIVRLLGDVAVVHAATALAGRYAGQPFAGTFAYTRAWRRCGDAWRVEAAHCSAITA